MIATLPSEQMRNSRCTSGKWWPGGRHADKEGVPRCKLSTHEADDILDGFHCFRRDHLRTLRAITQNRIDIDRILDQFLHLGANRPEFRDSEIDQRSFEGRKLPAAKLPEHLSFTHSL